MSEGPGAMAGATVVGVGSSGGWKEGVLAECCDQGGQARVEEEAGVVVEIASQRRDMRMGVGAVAGGEGGNRVETRALPAEPMGWIILFLNLAGHCGR